MIREWCRSCLDWWIYRRAGAACERLAEQTSGIVYVLYLRLGDLTAGLSPEVRRAAEFFYESQKVHIARKLRKKK